MFGIIATTRSSPVPRRCPDLDPVHLFPRRETTGGGDREKPTAASRRGQRTAAGPAPDLRVFEPESRPAEDIDRGRARRLLAADLTYIPHPSFDDPGARDAILAPSPEPDAFPFPGRITPAMYRDSFLAGFRGAPILSRGQEAHLFRQMNYLKCLAARLRDRIDPRCPAAADLDELERLHAAARKLKNQIVEANLRLVVSVASKRVRPGYDLSERVSDGNFALLMAVDRFDFSRGHRFSTYATWAILNELARFDRRQRRRCNRLYALYEDSLAAPETGSDAHEREEDQGRRREAVGRLLGRLDGRERRILARRYGIGGGPEQTLVQIGRDLGISKERVRQILARAQDKLRKFARLASLEPSEL